MQNRNAVGDTLHSRRYHRRLTLRQLAQLSGICCTKLHYIEHGLVPRPDEVERLAEALDCTPADLGQRPIPTSPVFAGGER